MHGPRDRARRLAHAVGPLFGFNMRWTNLPAPLDGAPGLIRWTPVDAPTAYQVWYMEPDKVFKTQTTVADEREYYTFHQDATWSGTVHWRIRAVRALYGVDAGNNARNGLPATSYGPWSPVYTSTNTPFTHGTLAGVETISDSISTAAIPAAHHVMPAFAYSGDTGLDGSATELYRVYVATDRDCVNIVFRGAVVGSPAYAPRWNGTLGLPRTQSELLAARTKFLAAGAEGLTTMADNTPLTANEAVPPSALDLGPISSGEDDSPSNGDTDGPPSPTPGPSTFAPATLAVDKANVAPPVDLWDTDWPTGRYYWTVVPVGTHMGRVRSKGDARGDGDRSDVGDRRHGRGQADGRGPRFPHRNRAGAGEKVTVVSAAGTSVTISPDLQTRMGPVTPFSAPAGASRTRTSELPQDACAPRRVTPSTKTGQPALASSERSPSATGFSPTRRADVADELEGRRSTAPRSSPGSRPSAPRSTRCSGARRATRSSR